MNEPPPHSNVRQLHCAPRVFSSVDASANGPDSTKCTFCRKSLEAAKYLIGNANARICEACLTRYSKLLARDSSLTTSN
jgi:hypothetical protein